MPRQVGDRITVSTTLNQELYQKIREIAFRKGTNANTLIEEGMEIIVEKNSQYLYTKNNNDNSKDE